MTILRGTLSALAAVFVGLLGPGLFFALRGINNSKATGLAAVVAGFLESFFSPLFWILAVLFFALFFAASRLSSKPLRILLFWTPVTAISILGLGIFSLFTFLWVQVRREWLQNQARSIIEGFWVPSGFCGSYAEKTLRKLAREQA
jgi:hypothetical protein